MISLAMNDWSLAKLVMGKATKRRVCELSWIANQLKALRASACLAVANPFGGVKFNNWRQKRCMLAQNPPTTVSIMFRGCELRVGGGFDKHAPLTIEYTPENIDMLLKAWLMRGTTSVCACVCVCVRGLSQA